MFPLNFILGNVSQGEKINKTTKKHLMKDFFFLILTPYPNIEGEKLAQIKISILTFKTSQMNNPLATAAASYSPNH